ncbi:MAG: hypothetical protein FWD27_05295 [Coriobacteriia bacterium]|nr:hypothetical protein [Coriobacteriia bacterium]
MNNEKETSGSQASWIVPDAADISDASIAVQSSPPPPPTGQPVAMPCPTGVPVDVPPPTGVPVDALPPAGLPVDAPLPTGLPIAVLKAPAPLPYAQQVQSPPVAQPAGSHYYHSAPPQQAKKGLSAGAIVGIVLGAVFLLGLLIVGVIFVTSIMSTYSMEIAESMETAESTQSSTSSLPDSNSSPGITAEQDITLLSLGETVVYNGMAITFVSMEYSANGGTNPWLATFTVKNQTSSSFDELGLGSFIWSGISAELESVRCYTTMSFGDADASNKEDSDPHSTAHYVVAFVEKPLVVGFEDSANSPKGHLWVVE